ncbi:unnamed protein product [Durusdinium trenchii]|uniref:Uncharacterized protein n=1 Tax=Durusdinium trenchii TaxID=1381693 RepID=A0ABP0RZW3_9DINO
MFVQGDDCEGSAFDTWENVRSVYPLGLGDFYREQDDVVRGITLNTSDALPSESFDWPSLEDSDWSKALEVHSEAEKRQVDAATLVFGPEDLPPMLPPESDYVEANTVHLSNETPGWMVGHRLLSFLQEKAVSHIKKVNKKKFTMKASVLCNGNVCEIKVRAYRTGQERRQETLVMLHRLQGDSIAFNALFRLLKQDLTSLTSELKAPCAVPAEVSPLPEASSHEVHELPAVAQTKTTAPPNSAFLTPLMDAAHNAEDTQAQAEAAASLAAAAEDTGSVNELCTHPRAPSVIQKLLEVNCFEVSCQVMRLIVKLAVTPGAEAVFRDGAVRLLQKKVNDLANGKMLKQQFSQAMEKLKHGKASRRVLCQ